MVRIEAALRSIDPCPQCPNREKEEDISLCLRGTAYTIAATKIVEGKDETPKLRQNLRPFTGQRIIGLRGEDVVLTESNAGELCEATVEEADSIVSIVKNRANFRVVR